MPQARRRRKKPDSIKTLSRDLVKKIIPLARQGTLEVAGVVLPAIVFFSVVLLMGYVAEGIRSPEGNTRACIAGSALVVAYVLWEYRRRDPKMYGAVELLFGLVCVAHYTFGPISMGTADYISLPGGIYLIIEGSSKLWR